MTVIWTRCPKRRHNGHLEAASKTTPQDTVQDTTWRSAILTTTTTTMGQSPSTGKQNLPVGVEEDAPYMSDYDWGRLEVLGWPESGEEREKKAACTLATIATNTYCKNGEEPVGEETLVDSVYQCLGNGIPAAKLLLSLTISLGDAIKRKAIKILSSDVDAESNSQRDLASMKKNLIDRLPFEVGVDTLEEAAKQSLEKEPEKRTIDPVSIFTHECPIVCRKKFQD